MKSRKGIGIVGIIIGIIILIIVLSVIGTVVIPGIKKLPSAAEQTAVDIGILPETHYKIEFLDKARGYLEFRVLEEKTNYFVTDFNPITGYQVSEDGIPKPVTRVNSFDNLYVAVVVDPGVSAYQTVINDIIDQLKNSRFNNTYVSFVSVTNPNTEPTFLHVDRAECTTCTGTGADYWGAVKTATHALPAGERNYNTLLIISDGACTQPCNDTELITEATQGLLRSDLQNTWVLATNTANCKNSVLSITSNTVNLNLTAPPFSIPSKGLIYYVSSDSKGKNRCGASQMIKDQIRGVVPVVVENSVVPIKLYYQAKTADGQDHQIAVRITKRPYTGRGNITINYPAVIVT